MKVRLLHPDHDFDMAERLPWDLTDMVDSDLELSRIYAAMAGGDPVLLDIARKVVRATVVDPRVLVYRQQILEDVVAHRAIVQHIYDLAVDGSEVNRKVFLGGMLFRDPEAVLHRSVRILEYLSNDIKQLRGLADRHSSQFHSRGFRRLLAMVSEQLCDEYLRQLDDQLAELQLPRGVLLSAQLGLGNKGERHQLHQPPRRSWWEKLADTHDSHGFVVDDRDEAGTQALAALAGRAVNDVANVVAQSSDHVRGFFERLRTELGFYLACANLHDRLSESNIPTCYPVPTAPGCHRLNCRGLRDAGLCLATTKHVIGNGIDATGKTMVMITGANEGGKSTFLRSLGVAQVMMQAGMFVVAASFEADVCNAILTHFKREEDITMTHGKLDEELARMSRIADFIGPGSLVLCNESFASTNEREGSQIARGVISAMTEAGVKVVFVTHLYDLAQSMCERRDPGDLFLRAERRPDGVRTFRLNPGDPEPTSYGEDSFQRVFGVIPR